MSDQVGKTNAEEEDTWLYIPSNVEVGNGYIDNHQGDTKNLR